MTFDPMKFYEDGKRRESRWGAVTPFILVGLLLLVMGVAGYFGYKGARPKHTLGSPAIIPYTKLKAGPATGGVCVYRQGEGWICGDPALSHPELSHAFHVARPRKHKRKVDGHLVWYDFKFTPSPNQPYESWRFINIIPAELSCTKRTKTSGIHCESRPLTPADIENYKPMTENSKPTGDTQAQYWGTGGSKEPCTKDNIIHCLDISGGDVPRTKIPEIAPQQDFELGAGSGKNTFTMCTKEGETGCVDVMCEGRNIGAGCPNYVPPSSKPSCVMPADIDVCPVQMLDPKATDDEGKEKTRASMAAAMITCVLTPDASPIILLKSGATPVPCATLKWATDAVDADKKKASHD